MDRNELLRQYNIDPYDVEKAGVDWEEFERIRKDFQAHKKKFEHAMDSVAEHLRDIDCVHSIRARLKDPEHLLIKCVRKKLENPARQLTVQTYRKEITDLIGIRALHLLKEEWMPIHRDICGMWKPLEEPTAYIRKGDSEAMQKAFEEEGCVVKERPSGYRSIHYLVGSNTTRETFIAEIQVRTIFEEAWSELDHRIRYPQKCDPLLSSFLDVFNRVAGNADEMASYVWHLSDELKKAEQRQQESLSKKDEALAAKDAAIAALQQEVATFQLGRAKRDSLNARIKDFSETLGKVIGGIVVGADFVLTTYAKLPRGTDGRIQVEPIRVNPLREHILKTLRASNGMLAEELRVAIQQTSEWAAIHVTIELISTELEAMTTVPLGNGITMALVVQDADQRWSVCNT